MSRALRASLLLGVAGCSYGMFLTIMQIANDFGYMRQDLMVGQYLFATVVVGVIVLIKHRNALRIKQVLKLFLVGVFGFTCSFCMYETVAATNTSFAVTMLFQYVWLGILFDCIITRKMPSKLIVIATVLVVAGTPCAAGFFNSESVFNLAGFLWGLGAAVTYVGMLWCSARLETQLPSITRTFYFSVAETILALCITPTFFIAAFNDPFVWVFAIPIGIFSVVIPCLLIMMSAPHVPMGITTIMTGMELPSTILFAAIILGTSHSAIEIFGVLLICVGIIVANWDSVLEFRNRLRQSKVNKITPPEK